MKELAEWLINIEHLAGGLYRNASVVLKDDVQLAGFLEYLAEDEARHGKIMSDVVSFLAQDGHSASAVILDDGTKNRIEAPFLDCNARLGSDTLRREHIVHCVASAEFSEWNDLFVYVINAVKQARKDLAFSASAMQAHRRYIESFIGSLPEGQTYLQALRGQPSVWRTRILVVDDYEDIRELMSALLTAEGDVETAANGLEALGRTQQQLFDVVISDVDMPLMNGLDFFRMASRSDPSLGRRFLFICGNPSDEVLEFAQTNHLRLLQKPMQIADLRDVMQEMLHQPTLGNKLRQASE